MQETSEQSEELREMIRAAYRQGEEAVISLVENLLKQGKRIKIMS